MDNIDLTQFKLPLSKKDFITLHKLEWKSKINSSDFPKELKDEYNHHLWEKQRIDWQRLLDSGEAGQDD